MATGLTGEVPEAGDGKNAWFRSERPEDALRKEQDAAHLRDLFDKAEDPDERTRLAGQLDDVASRPDGIADGFDDAADRRDAAAEVRDTEALARDRDAAQRALRDGVADVGALDRHHGRGRTRLGGW